LFWFIGDLFLSISIANHRVIIYLYNGVQNCTGTYTTKYQSTGTCVTNSAIATDGGTYYQSYQWLTTSNPTIQLNYDFGVSQ
jgi:hypothetical protein